MCRAEANEDGSIEEVDDRSRTGGHQHDRETVVAFAPDGLDFRGAHARLGGDQFVEAKHALNPGIKNEKRVLMNS
jgi:hypothetical protein